ncbi:hypothetical protein TanjilG_06948 [Lupinus angustifolius]|uniref:Uncharacterized protein n=1 Tax=Lupinus angustifolius TaxID=3871 RepID=A0A394DFF2_LUPAN|nr:hypothetical protein TanjilG_06948 [Lupinus angustifolius]
MKWSTMERWVGKSKAKLMLKRVKGSDIGDSSLRHLNAKDLKGRDKVEGLITSVGEEDVGLVYVHVLDCLSEPLVEVNVRVSKGIIRLVESDVLEVGESSLHPKVLGSIIPDKDIGVVRNGKKETSLILKPPYQRSIIGGKKGVV